MAELITFPMVEELSLEELIGAWGQVSQELSYSFDQVTGSLHPTLAHWKGEARTRFTEWWWGANQSPTSGNGAKHDFETLLKMIDVIVAALDDYNRSVDDINTPLVMANQLIEEHTNNGVFKMHDSHDPKTPVSVGIEAGTMYPQWTGSGPNWYLKFICPGTTFPYTPDLNPSLKVPDWLTKTNAEATNAVQAFNAACESAITKLRAIPRLSADINVLTPYKGPYQGEGGMTEPDATAYGGRVLDPIWEELSGGDKTRPWRFRESQVVGKVTHKDGKVDISSGGDPFDPANVPKSYFGPSIATKVWDTIKEYGPDALTVLLVAGGQVEAATVIDTFLDSSAFLSALFDLADARSVVGLVLDGYDLLVDTDQVPNIAEALAKELLDENENPELWAEFGDKLTSMIEKRILKEPKVNGRRSIDVTSLLTPTAGEDAAAREVGGQDVVDPISSFLRTRGPSTT